MTLIQLSSTEIRVDRSDVMPARIPVETGVLNVLPQVRKSINGNGDMADLVESIWNKGQAVPGRVLALTPRNAGSYLRELNEFWDTKHSLRKLRKCQLDGVEYYLIVVYGHRRLEACRQASARLQDGEVSSSCFDGTYLCDVYFNLPFEVAVASQLTENLYVRPPKHEEVAAMWRYWRCLRRTDPQLTPAQFAKQAGLKTDTVRDMLRFCSLPEQVQARIQPDVSGGKATYSLLLQVARRVEAFETFGKPMSELEILRLVDYLVANRTQASAYASQVAQEIDNLHGEQKDLFAELLSKPIDTDVIRKVAAGNLVHGIAQLLQYLAIINTMTRNSESFGGLSPYAPADQADSPAEYSPDSPARWALRMVEVLKETVPDLAEMLRRDEKSNAKLCAALEDLRIEGAVFEAVLRQK